MLLRTIFTLAFLAILSESLVHGAAALAQAALRERAIDAVRVAFASGTRSAQASLATGTTPLPQATCAYADASGCAILVQTTFATPAPAPSASTCPGTPCTIVMQGNTVVSESRAQMLVFAVATAANGAQLAQRGGAVAFRTFAPAPYAAIVGGADGTIDPIMDGGPGDDAGNATTLITVELDPQGGGAPTAANVWQNAVEAPPSTSPAWDR
jgi:hypothetical protein